MQSTGKIAALAFLSWWALSSNGTAQAASMLAPPNGIFHSIAARAAQLVHEVMALETEILTSVPQITWAQIKAKYHDTQNPKGQ